MTTPEWGSTTQLGSHDDAGFRKTYAEVLKRFGNRPGFEVPQELGLLFALCPGATPDPAPALEAARRSVVVAPKDYNSLSALGGVLFRAGRWGEAIVQLQQADSNQSSVSDRRHVFWLAMAHWHLGHRQEARRWFEAGERWQEQTQTKTISSAAAGTLYWFRRLIIQHLYEEAKALLDSGQP